MQKLHQLGSQAIGLLALAVQSLLDRWCSGTNHAETVASITGFGVISALSVAGIF